MKGAETHLPFIIMFLLLLPYDKDEYIKGELNITCHSTPKQIYL